MWPIVCLHVLYSKDLQFLVHGPVLVHGLLGTGLASGRWVSKASSVYVHRLCGKLSLPAPSPWKTIFLPKPIPGTRKIGGHCFTGCFQKWIHLISTWIWKEQFWIMELDKKLEQPTENRAVLNLGDSFEFMSSIIRVTSGDHGSLFTTNCWPS